MIMVKSENEILSNSGFFAPFPNRCLANLGQAACRQISLNEVFHNGCTFKELLLFNMNQKKHKMRPVINFFWSLRLQKRS